MSPVEPSPEHTGPVVPDAVTFGWLRLWVPSMVSVGVAVFLASGVWYTLRAEDERQVVAVVQVRQEMERQRVRQDTLEQTNRDVLSKLDQLDRKIERLICRVSPPDCPKP